MKKLLVFALLWTAFLGYTARLSAQSGYRVDLVVDDHWWETKDNFGVWLRAVISYNGNPIPNSNDYYYWWWAYFSNEGYWKPLISNFGLNEVVPETKPPWTIRVYVIATDSVSHTFTDIISAEVGPYSAPGQVANHVEFTANQQNGQPISVLSVTANHWRYTINRWRNYIPYQFLTQNHDEAIQSTPSYVPSLGQKIRYWNQYQSNILNHDTFHVSTELSELVAQYWSVDGTVTVKTDLIDAPGTTGGVVQFRDPWYIDYPDPEYGNNWRNRGMQEARLLTRDLVDQFAQGWRPDFTTTYPESPEDPYRGVFLGQDYNIPGNPHYSLGAPFTQSIGGVGSYFMEWTAHPDSAQLRSPDKDTSAVVFKIAGATITALYKGHLYCTSAGLAANNQRKVAVTASGVYCIVYTSANRVWFTRHSGGAATQEYEVSAGSAYALNSLPSVCSNGDIINIVWQSTDTVYSELVEGYYSKIHLRRYDAYSGNWGSVETIWTTVVPSADFGLSPVIDASALWSNGENDAKVVVWRDYDGLKAQQFKDGEWSEGYDVPGTDDASMNASIALSSASTYALAWEDVSNAAIRYVDIGTGGYLTFSNAYQVSPSGWESNHRPSVGVVNGTSVVAWESHNNITEGGSSVHIRKRPSGNWESSIQSFSASGLTQLSPVVGTVSGSYAFSVVWTYSNDILRATWDGSDWSGPTTIVSSANEPNANLHGDGEIETIWRTTSGTIGYAAHNPSLGKVSVTAKVSDVNPINLVYRVNRHALVDLGGAVGDAQAFKGMVAFEIAGMKLTGTSGEEKLSLARSGMQSDRFTVSKNLSSLSVAGAIYGAKLTVPAEVGTLSAEPLAWVLVRDVQSGDILQELWSVPFSSLTDVTNNSFGQYRVVGTDLSAFAGREVYVDVEVVGQAMGVEPIIVTDYFILHQRSEQLAKNGSNLKDGKIPTVYSLHQNYPNPFNPSTTIGFDLPEAQRVKIVVYNILGEEVKVVVDEYIEAGIHTRGVQFTGLPSGVYLYRIIAGRYSESKKLLVLK